MADIDDILSGMKRNPKGVRFNDLSKVCEHFFGSPRQSGSSHKVFRTPWQGDPRVNIQNLKGKAKPYLYRDGMGNDSQTDLAVHGIRRGE